jgi:hypothetical protein
MAGKTGGKRSDLSNLASIDHSESRYCHGGRLILEEEDEEEEKGG